MNNKITVKLESENEFIKNGNMSKAKKSFKRKPYDFAHQAKKKGAK